MDKNLLIRFFEGQATTDEEMKVRKWMEASTENRRTYFKERKMYDMTLLLSKDTKKETVSQSSKKKFKFRKFIEIAAVAAITLVITLFYKNQERQEYWLTAQKISVPAGQRINLELSDGTKVWLNSRTKIEYPAVWLDRHDFPQLPPGCRGLHDKNLPPWKPSLPPGEPVHHQPD